MKQETHPLKKILEERFENDKQKRREFKKGKSNHEKSDGNLF